MVRGGSRGRGQRCDWEGTLVVVDIHSADVCVPKRRGSLDLNGTSILIGK